jgi:hypothetical protein
MRTSPKIYNKHTYTRVSETLFVKTTTGNVKMMQKSEVIHDKLNMHRICIKVTGSSQK